MSKHTYSSVLFFLMFSWIVKINAHTSLTTNLFLSTVSNTVEICNNGIDDDGDGLIDKDDPDCCNVQIEYICNDQGTTGDPSDDTFSVLMTITNGTGSSTYEISGDARYSDIAYDSPINIGEFPVFDSDSLVFELNDEQTAGCSEEVIYADPPQPCSDCSIEILDLTSSNCINNTYSVEVTVRYQNIPSSQLEINGQFFDIADPAANSRHPATQSFLLTGLNCPQNSPLEVNVSVPNDASCGDRQLITPPDVCSITINSIELSDCTLDNAYAEISFSYQNAVGKLSINDCEIMPASTSGTETFLLQNIKCATVEAQQINIGFNDHPACQVQTSVTPPCPKPRICHSNGK